jgi:hypothetical protein
MDAPSVNRGGPGEIRVGRVKIRRIPDYFMERYDREIALWAENFRKIGPVKSIVLREGYLADLSPNEERGAQLIQVKLIAKMSGRGVEIEPFTQRDETLIALHCEKLQKAGIPARVVLVEPERPWLPFMPRVVQ